MEMEQQFVDMNERDNGVKNKSLVHSELFYRGRVCGTKGAE